MDIVFKLCLQTANDATLGLYRLWNKGLSAVIDGDNKPAHA